MGGASACTYRFASATGLGFYAGEARLRHFDQKRLRAETWCHRHIWALMAVSFIPTFFLLSSALKEFSPAFPMRGDRSGPPGECLGKREKVDICRGLSFPHGRICRTQRNPLGATSSQPTRGEKAAKWLQPYIPVLGFSQRQSCLWMVANPYFCDGILNPGCPFPPPC